MKRQAIPTKEALLGLMLEQKEDSIRDKVPGLALRGDFRQSFYSSAAILCRCTWWLLHMVQDFCTCPVFPQHQGLHLSAQSAPAHWVHKHLTGKRCQRCLLLPPQEGYIADKARHSGPEEGLDPLFTSLERSWLLQHNYQENIKPGWVERLGELRGWGSEPPSFVWIPHCMLS